MNADSGVGLIHFNQVLRSTPAQVRVLPGGSKTPNAAGSFAALAAASLAAAPMRASGQQAASGVGAASTLGVPGGLMAADFAHYLGRSTGTGQCVALVQAANPGIGPTRTWKCGAPVQGNTDLQPGTAIATFNGALRYANAADGSSHAAIYLGQNERGVQVLDQWRGSAAAVRTIPWHNPGAAAANTGAAFHVVQHAS